MEITIKIDNRGDAPGTLGWLVKNAATIKIGISESEHKCAWLKNHSGEILECLFCEDDNEINPLMNIPDNPIGPEIQHTYTDAAWAIMEKLIEIAIEHAQEPREMAKAVRINVQPIDDREVKSLLKASANDLVARQALQDRLEEIS